jgi:hypothetical protein
MNSEAYVGVDVSKDRLDVNVLPNNDAHQFVNDDAGIIGLTKLLKRLNPKLIVFESTGGLETPASVSVLIALRQAFPARRRISWWGGGHFVDPTRCRNPRCP